ncbi:unnamed protein product [Pylaiella littoralis]
MALHASNMKAVVLAVLCFAPRSATGFSMVASIPKAKPLEGVQQQQQQQQQQQAAPPVFKKDFAKPMQIPEESITGVVEVLRSGRLNRYSSVSAETSQVAQLEQELVDFAGKGTGDGVKYALGVNSCSSAIVIALLSCGVKPGDEVLSNGFTFTAVPSAILRIGASPVLVECLHSWVLDLDDLEKKAATSKAKVLLVSHMRSKASTLATSRQRVCDMDRLYDICEKNGITVIEDCAHALGVTWRGEQLGNRAKARAPATFCVAAYSCQSDKLINSGEGGFLTTNDEELFSKAIFMSGCYERRYGKHSLRGSDELMEEAMLSERNLSVRMTEMTAAVIRPLLANLPERVEQFSRRYQEVIGILEKVSDLIEVPKPLEHATVVGDHLNFHLINPTEEENFAFQAKIKEMGVPLNWLRSPVNARWHVNWRGYGGPVQDMPGTDAALYAAYDLKLPPHFDDEDFGHIAENIAYAARATVRAGDQ